MNREEAVQAGKETGSGVAVTNLTSDDVAPVLPITQAAHLPGQAFDEMYASGGDVRSHYGAVHTRLTTLPAP